MYSMTIFHSFWIVSANIIYEAVDAVNSERSFWFDLVLAQILVMLVFVQGLKAMKANPK